MVTVAPGPFQQPRSGWRCPVCGRGVSPDVNFCRHYDSAEEKERAEGLPSILPAVQRCLKCGSQYCNGLTGCPGFPKFGTVECSQGNG